MLDSFIKWFTHINWVSWDSLASIGQIIGAVATVWTARVALGQMEEARKQNELAIKQMEEAREREKEAMKPELTPKVILTGKAGGLKINVILANNKPVPVYIDDIYTNIPDEENQELFETDAPKKVPYGDICTTKIHLRALGDLLGDYDDRIIRFRFSYTTGDELTISFLILSKSKGEYKIKVPLFFYLVGEVYEKDKIIAQGTLIFPPYPE
ncbi:hypothetical protein MK805_13860 [Shimazuella sp. AN120528]|uniref:hypothetical protein n=1 Tax=Shimazuella soli TaxID=1892854 RepID=UPI001F0ED7DC|nr:hypothetical protein [Shimazuella soli]MCH5586024.1 hypothetical protein [Shimazuella soli]